MILLISGVIFEIVVMTIFLGYLFYKERKFRYIVIGTFFVFSQLWYLFSLR